MRDLVEAGEVEARGDVGREEGVSREAVGTTPADDATGDLDAGALHVGLQGRRAEDQDAVTGLREGRGTVRDVGAEAAVEGSRDAVVGDRDGAHGRAEADLAGEDHAGTRAATAEGEVAVDVHEVGDGADRAVAEQRGARADLEDALADGAAGDDARDRGRVGGEHQRAGRQGEVGGEGALAAEGQDARARLRQRGHARVLRDHRGDRQARLGQSGVDGEDGRGSAELDRGRDVRHRNRGLVGRGDGVGFGQDELRAAGDQGVAHRAFVIEGQRGQRVIAGEVERAAADEADAGGRGDLAFVGHHGDRRVVGGSQAADHEVTRDHDDARRGAEVQEARVDEGRTGVVVRDRGAGRGADRHGAAAGLDEVHRAGEQQVEVQVALVGIDVEVRTGRGQRAGGVGRREHDGVAVVGHEAHAEGDRRAREGEGLGGHSVVGLEAPGVRDVRAGDRAGGRSFGVVTRSHGRGGDIRTGEARRGITVIIRAHLGHAEDVGVGREGRAVRDRPAADDPVGHAGRGEGGAVDLGELQRRRSRQAGAAEGIGAAAVERGPAVEVDRRTGAAAAEDEVPDGDLVRRAHADVRVGVQLVAAELGRHAVEVDHVVRGTAADDGEGAAGEGDRVGGGETDRAFDGVEAVVVPGERTLREAQAGGAGERTAVDELERAAADHRRAGVVAGGRERGGGVTAADEAQAAGEATGERAVILRREDRAGEAGDGAALAGQRVDAGKAADRLVLGADVEDRVGAVEGHVRQADRARRGGDREGVVQAGVQAQRAVVDSDRAGEDAGAGLQFHRAAVIQDEAARGRRNERGVHVERGAREDVEVGGAGGRADERTHVEGRRTILDEETGGVREAERQQVARGAVLAEDAGGQARGDRGGAAGRQGVDGRRGVQGGGARETGVVSAAHGVRQSGELAVGEGACEARDAITGQEARADAGDGGVRQHVAADRHDGAAVDSPTLRAREGEVRDGDVGLAGAREVAESGEDERTIGLEGVEVDRGGGRRVGAQDERRGVGDGVDRRAGGDAGTADGHAGDQPFGARHGDVGGAVDGGGVERGVGVSQGADVERERAGGIGRELDATAAVEGREERDAFGGGAGGGAADGQEAALHVDTAADGGAEAVVEIGRRVVDPERAAGVDVERGLGREGRDEGLAGAFVGERAAADGERAERAGDGLGRGQGQLAGADLVDQAVGGVVEAHEATAERRIRVVEAHVERRGAERAEDVAGTGEAAPGGIQVVEVETRAGVEGERREAGAGVGHAGLDAARGDGEAAREEVLGAEFEHAVALLRDAAGRADDALEGERGAERVDVAEAAGRDRGYVHEVGRGAEVDATFDVRRRGDVVRRGPEAAGADGQDAAGTGAVGLVGGEGADEGGVGGAFVVDGQLGDGVVTEVAELGRTVEGHFVAGGDDADTVGLDLAAVDDQSLRDVGRERDVRGTADAEPTLVDERAAVVGVHVLLHEDRAVARLHEFQTATDDAQAEDLPAAAGRIQEQFRVRSRDETTRAEVVRIGTRRGEHDGARGDRQGLARRKIDLHARRIAETQGVDRQVVRDRDDGAAGVQVDVRRGRRSDERVRVRGGVGVSREARSAERADAKGVGIRGEVAGAGSVGAVDRPAAEHAVGQHGSRGDVGTVELAEQDAVRGTAGGEVDGAVAGRAHEVADGEGRRGTEVVALLVKEERVAAEQVDGAEGLRSGRLGASAELEVTLAQVDDRRVVDAVRVVLEAVLVVEVQVGVTDVEGAGRREGGVAVHDGQAAVDQRRAGVRAVAPEVDRALTRAGEAHVAGEAGGQLAAAVVGVHHEVAVAGVARDDRALVGDDGFREHAVGELGLAVEIEGAADDGEVVVRLDGVRAAELDRALVEHEEAAERVGTDGAEAVDGRDRGSDGERALAGLDQRRAAVADAVAARERGRDGEVAEGPDVEAGGGGRDLVDDAAGDDGGAARADEDAAGTQAELDAVGERQAGVAFDRQRVALGVEADGQVARAGGGEQDVRVRRHALGGAAEDGRVDLVFRGVEPADVVARGAEGDEGEVAGVSAGVVQVDDGPRQDAAVLGADGAAFAGERRRVGELDGSATGAGDLADAAEEQRDARGGGALRRGVVTPRGAAEPERRLRERQVLLLHADHAEALAERGVREAFEGRRRRGRGAEEVDVTAADGEVLVDAAGRVAHATRGEVDDGVVQTERRADVQVDA